MTSTELICHCILVTITLVIWYRKKTGKFVVSNEKNSTKVEVENDLYDFAQPNLGTGSSDGHEHIHSEKIDLSKSKPCREHSPYKNSQSQNDLDDKRNTVLTNNPLFAEYEMYDSMVEQVNASNYSTVDEQQEVPTNNTPSDEPLEPSEIYMNINYNNCGAQKGTNEEYSYCKR